MHRQAWRAVSALIILGLFFITPARAADPEIDRLLRGPVGKDWVTNGGNLTNQRYSTLKQIDTSNVGQAQGRLDDPPEGLRVRRQVFGRGDAAGQGRHHVRRHRQRRCIRAERQDRRDPVGALVGHRPEASPPSAAAGSIAALAMGEGMLFLGQLDANVVALDIKTGKEVWKTPIEDWQNGYGVTSAPLYYDGIVYSGITGGEYRRARPPDRARRQDRQDPVAVVHPACAGRGRRRDLAGRHRPLRCAAARRSGTRRRSIRELGLIYFAIGNCGPDYDGSMREGDNLFCASIVAIERQDRRICLAFPGGAPRHLGL